MDLESACHTFGRPHTIRDPLVSFYPLSIVDMYIPKREFFFFFFFLKYAYHRLNEPIHYIHSIVL